MRLGSKITFITLLFIFTTGAISHSEDFSSIEGTYVLKSREFPDGTVVTPPNAVGLYTLIDGNVNLNIAAKDKDGNIHSRSLVGTYEIKDTTYSVNTRYTAENEGSGIKYNFDLRSGVADMTKSGDKIQLLYPLSDKFYGLFGPDTLTVTIKGEYTDNWVKVK